MLFLYVKKGRAESYGVANCCVCGESFIKKSPAGTRCPKHSWKNKYKKYKQDVSVCNEKCFECTHSDCILD